MADVAPAAGIGADQQTTRLSEADAHILLEAVDSAFFQTLHGHYGGGVFVIINRGGAAAQQVLRDVPVGLSDAVVLELEFRGGGRADSGISGFRDSFAGSLTVLGAVRMLDPPERGAGDVDVLTEVFDDHDPNSAADDGFLATGVLLWQDPQGVAGQMPGGGVHVVRNDETEQAAASWLRLGRRGWLPRPLRGRVNRGAGLGSNGHRRASAPQQLAPVSRALLKRLGDSVATAASVGGAIERLVVGLRTGDFGRSA